VNAADACWRRTANDWNTGRTLLWADGTGVALGEASRAGLQRVGGRLETKNDESRFGLTRAPFFKRRGSLERGQSLARHRAAQSGNWNINPAQLRPSHGIAGANHENRNREKGSQPHSQWRKQPLSTVFIDDPSSNWFALAALIYGSAVMAIVIVALVKSARRRRAEAHKGR